MIERDVGWVSKGLGFSSEGRGLLEFSSGVGGSMANIWFGDGQSSGGSLDIGSGRLFCSSGLGLIEGVWAGLILTGLEVENE